MKGIIKKITYLLLYYAYFWRKSNLSGLMVLTYHRITEKPDFQDPLKVYVRTFEKQIIFLKKHYTILSGAQFADIIKESKAFPQNSCLITFDDGWMDNYIYAYPILKKYQVPAIIFIATDYVSTNRVFWHEELSQILVEAPSNFDEDKFKVFAEKWPKDLRGKISRIMKCSSHEQRFFIDDLITYLKGFDNENLQIMIEKLKKFFVVSKEENCPAVLSWEQVLSMSNNNITIGSHTKSHVILTQISACEAEKELKESKHVIEKKIGKSVDFLSYPNGNHNESIIRIAKEAGYLASFACLPGINDSCEDRFRLKRKHIREHLSLGLSRKFSELFFKVELSDIRSNIQSWINNYGGN